jgi:copper chaperone CopZ
MYRLTLNEGRRKMTAQTTLKVIGMSCGGCAGNVEKALKGVAGVTKAAVNLKAGNALVEYDPEKVTEKDLAKAVKSVGYGVG